MHNSKGVIRHKWIDIYKGLLIFFVILGHLTIPQHLYNFIFIFHMYAFFFISGITFNLKKEQTFGNLLIQNVKSLYIPYLFFAFAWNVTNIVTQLYLGNSFDFSAWGIVKNIASVIIGTGVFDSTASIGPAWFLLALFFVRITCWLILKIGKEQIWVFGVVSLAFFAVGYYVNGYSFLPFKLCSSFTCYIFVFVGYCCKTIYVRVKNIGVHLKLLGILIAYGIALIMSIIADKSLILVSNTLPSNPVVVIVGGLAGCFGTLCLSVILENINILSSCFAFWGANSLIIMGVHSEINFALRLLLEEILGIPSVYLAFIILILTLIIVIPICTVFNTYFPFLTGKRKVEEQS